MTCGLLKAVGCYNRIALHHSQNASEDDLCCKPFECTCLLMLTQNVRGKKCGTFKVAQNLRLGKKRAEKNLLLHTCTILFAEKRVFFDESSLAAQESGRFCAISKVPHFFHLIF